MTPVHGVASLVFSFVAADLVSSWGHSFVWTSELDGPASTKTEILPRLDRGVPLKTSDRVVVDPSGAETERVPRTARPPSTGRLGGWAGVDDDGGGIECVEPEGAARQRA